VIRAAAIFLRLFIPGLIKLRQGAKGR
jgi:hypothetical protein